MSEQPIFRASKRQKFIRRKIEPSDDEDDAVQARFHYSRPNETKTEDLIKSDNSDQEISSVIKARRNNKPRIGGVHYSNTKATSKDDETSASNVIDSAQGSEEKFRPMNDRFVGSTGQVVNVDKHMMAYIDSELAKRRKPDAASTIKTPAPTNARSREAGHDQFPNSELDEEDETSQESELEEEKPPIDNKPLNITSTSLPQHTSHHHLSEVDIGSVISNTDNKRNKNLQLRRRPRKPRLGRDGKPLPPRPRKRRPSEDIARDKLVEDLLKEHAFASSTTAQQQKSVGSNTANASATGAGTDEQFAEQFRRQFMDALAERQGVQKARSANTASSSAIKDSGSANAGANSGMGPKLGGSRSARAKMAAMQKQQQGGGSSGQK